MSPVSVLEKSGRFSEEDLMLDALRNLSATPSSKPRNGSHKNNHSDKVNKNFNLGSSHGGFMRFSGGSGSNNLGLSIGIYRADLQDSNGFSNDAASDSSLSHTDHKLYASEKGPYKPQRQLKSQEQLPQPVTQHSSFSQPMITQQIVSSVPQFVSFPGQITSQSSGNSVFFPQSPPQEHLCSNRSPLHELGEKRRRISGKSNKPGPRRPYGDAKAHRPGQPPTPQTPSSTNYNIIAGYPPILQNNVLTMPSLAAQSVPLYQPLSANLPAGKSTPSVCSASIVQKSNMDTVNMAARGQLLKSSTDSDKFQKIDTSLSPGGAPLAPGYLRPLWKPGEVQLTRIVDGQTGPDAAAEYDDDGGHYIIKVGERFAWRYLIIKQLGQGTFGKVVQAWDERTQNYCAIKIIRAIPKYRDASKIELRILSMLSNMDPQGMNRCIRMLECFDYRNHVCIVTELYDMSIYDFLHDNSFTPFPGHHIACFAKQILTSVAYIHSLGLVHTDLKPENVLLRSSISRPGKYNGHCKANGSGYKQSRSGKATSRQELQCTDITLIDFGSAIFEDEYHPSVVSTRHYRAPEVIFGTGWSYACDLWSIGCLLIELSTGRVLFETRDDIEHLHMMQRTLQMKFDRHLLIHAAKNTTGAKLVTTTWPQSLKPVVDKPKIEAIDRMRTLEELVRAYAPYNEEKHFWDEFLDLVYRLMAPDPKDRIMASEALQHPWITNFA